MKLIPIIAGTRHELHLFLAANPWIDPSKVTNVVKPEDLLGHRGIVLALPDWQHSPSIHTPRKILEAISIRGMQLVALEQGAYETQPNQYNGQDGNGYQPIGGAKVLPPPSSL